MGQSFLTHDEKSSVGTPSPDLLQFNGGSHSKFFGSLSSVKETSTSSCSRSPLESDQEHSFRVASSPSSPSLPHTIENSYSCLVPSPIQPGNVSRLREKFMDCDRKQKESGGNERNSVISYNVGAKKELSELDCRFIRSATTSPHHVRPSTLPPRSPRTSRRRSLCVLSSSRNIGRNHPVYQKLDIIKSDNDLSECFRQMQLPASNNGSTFTRETSLGRHRPRIRPYVPQPRSVIIRAGYLPVVQTVDLIPAGRGSWTSAFPRREDSTSTAVRLGGGNVPEECTKTEELLVLTSPRSPQEERNTCEAVTNQGDHTLKVVKKDAETNTSADVLVLPKGTKTSVLLKTAMEVDGKKGSRRRRKKNRGLRRISRAIGRVMIRLVELF